jgi:hypothetical protein
MSKNTNSSTLRELKTLAAWMALPTMRAFPANFLVFTRASPLKVKIGIILHLSILINYFL